MRRSRLIGLAAATLVSFEPLLGLVLAGTIASALGCALDEGSVHPCLVLDVDLGKTLYTGAVLGWLMLVTWPAMLICAAVWTWLVLRGLVRRVRP